MNRKELFTNASLQTQNETGKVRAREEEMAFERDEKSVYVNNQEPRVQG
jgi:hypothetical protein